MQRNKQCQSITNIAHIMSCSDKNKNNSMMFSNKNFFKEYLSNKTTKSRNFFYNHNHSKTQTSYYSQTTKSTASFPKLHNQNKIKYDRNHKELFNQMIAQLIKEEKKDHFHSKKIYSQFKSLNKNQSLIKEEDNEASINQSLPHIIGANHNIKNINKSNDNCTPLCKNISDLNKKLMNTFTYQGKDEIKYSKQNMRTFTKFLINQKKKNAKRSFMITQQFYSLKNEGQAYSFITLEEGKSIDGNSTLTQLEIDNKIIMKNNSNENAKDFARKIMNINNKKQLMRSRSEGPIKEKINMFVLEKKINVLKVIQRKLRKESQLEKHLRYIKKYTVKEKEENSGMMINNKMIKPGVPTFLNTKFKKRTVTTFIGKHGKYFGAPV